MGSQQQQHPKAPAQLPLVSPRLPFIQVHFRKTVIRDRSPKGAGRCQRREQGPRLCDPTDKRRKPAGRLDSM